MMMGPRRAALLGENAAPLRKRSDRAETVDLLYGISALAN